MVLNIVSSRPRVAWYAIARQYAVHNTHDEVAALLVDEKSNWLKRNPVTAAKHFNTDSMFFSESFCNQLLTPPLVKLLIMPSEYSFRPKVHYIQKREILKDLVLHLQKQKHSSHCRRNKTCRFRFTKPPSSKTLITNDDPERGDNNQELAVFGKVKADSWH